MTAIHLWSELNRLNSSDTSLLLSSSQRQRIEESVKARFKASLIRKHREISKAIQGEPKEKTATQQYQRQTELPKTLGDEVDHDGYDHNHFDDSNALSDDEDNVGDIDARRVLKAAADEFVMHQAGEPVEPITSSSPSSVPSPSIDSSSVISPNSAAADTDLLLDVIKIELVADSSSNNLRPLPSSALHTPLLSSLSLLSLSQDGEDFALHEYVTRLSRHLLTRLPQLQSHIENQLSTKYWETIRRTPSYATLAHSDRPTQTEIEQFTLPSLDSSNVPEFIPSQTKLVVTFLRKDDPTSIAFNNRPTHFHHLPNSGSWRRQTFYFDELPIGCIIFGRSVHVDVTIPDSGVSRTHAKLSWTVNDQQHQHQHSPTKNTKSTLLYTDLDSTYGSRLNGQPLRGRHALLQCGSIIQIGKKCTIKILPCDDDDMKKKKARRQSEATGETSATAHTDANNSSSKKCIIQ